MFSGRWIEKYQVHPSLAGAESENPHELEGTMMCPFEAGVTKKAETKSKTISSYEKLKVMKLGKNTSPARKIKRNGDLWSKSFISVMEN